MARESDLVIAGAGPVGLALALALQGTGLRAPVAAREDEPPDRPIALAHGTALLLERLGVRLAATPIRAIHVSQRGRFGRTLIRAADHGLDELGRVVSYRSLVQALRRALDAPALPAVEGWSADRDGVLVRHAGGDGTRARLLVLSDGMPDAAARGRDYGQRAVVSHVRSQVAHANTAFERFTPDGPIGLLPDGDGFAVVWSTRPEQALALCAAGEAEFLEKLGAAFGTRVGRFVQAGPRSSFALALRHSPPAPGDAVIAIGNAAQALHPVAGQGLNLGMRDAWELAELISAAPAAELASAGFALRFAKRRRLDRRFGIDATDALVRIFSTDDARLAAARGAGLLALDLVPPARDFLARRMMFGARALP